MGQDLDVLSQQYLMKCLDCEVSRLSFEFEPEDNIYLFLEERYLEGELPMSYYLNYPPFHSFIMNYIDEKLIRVGLEPTATGLKVKCSTN